MKVLFLWARLPSYLAGFCRQFQRQGNHDLVIAGLASDSPSSSVAPFSETLYRTLSTVRMQPSEIASDEFIWQLIRNHTPDLLVISGWQYPPYRRLYTNREFLQIPKLLCCDNTWRGTLRQRVGRYFLAPLFKNAAKIWVPGNRGLDLMRRWNVDEQKVVQGMYSIDRELIRSYSAKPRETPDVSSERRLLFVGQLVRRKGFHLLIEAYRRYRESVANPWSLIVCGRGPLESLCQTAGVDFRGFVDGSQLPEVFAEADAFVLPSLYDSWGVVIAEAACAGLPIIASEACGAVDDLVIDSLNGFRIAAGRSDPIFQALVRLHELSVSDLDGMGIESERLSRAFSSHTVAERMTHVMEAVVDEWQRKWPR